MGHTKKNFQLTQLPQKNYAHLKRKSGHKELEINNFSF